MDDDVTVCSNCWFVPENEKYRKYCWQCRLRKLNSDGEFSSDPDDPTDYAAEAMNNTIVKIATIKVDNDNNITFEGDFWK